jgi:DNA-binding transcriptional MerR regulator
MRIGELSRRTGASTRALRHYERQGLLPARRAENGYRDFDEASVERVERLRALLAHGFALGDARELVACFEGAAGGMRPCPSALAGYEAKLRELDRRIGALAELRDRARAGLAALRRRAR